MKCKRSGERIFLSPTQPSPSRSEASARKNVDVVRDWDLGVTSSLKVLQNAFIFNMAENLDIQITL